MPEFEGEYLKTLCGTAHEGLPHENAQADSHSSKEEYAFGKFGTQYYDHIPHRSRYTTEGKSIQGSR